MSFAHRMLGSIPLPLTASLLFAGASSASARDMVVMVEPEGGPEAIVEVEVVWRPTRRVPFFSCSPSYNILSGHFQCDMKSDAVTTKRIEARREGVLLRFGPFPETRFGVSAYRVERITVRLPTEIIEVREKEQRRAAADVAKPPEAAYLYYESAEHRELWPREPAPAPLHPVVEYLEHGWPRQIVVRPERLRFGVRKLIGAIWDGLREVRRSPDAPEDPSREAAWAGWRWRRHHDGTDRLEHEPSGAVIVGGKGKGPGTIGLRIGQRVNIPVSPSPDDGSGDPALEEMFEVIAVAAADERVLEGQWGTRTQYGESRDWEGDKEGMLGESSWSLPIVRWRELAARAVHPRGLVMADGSVKEVKACWPASGSRAPGPTAPASPSGSRCWSPSRPRSPAGRDRPCRRGRSRRRRASSPRPP